MKKILAILLVVVMSLSMITPVFAGSYSDTAKTDYEAAIEHLSGLGVINGMGDGTYAPEKVVTRAEMAKLLVVALGLEQGAILLKGETQFADVDTNHWATGYINIAVAQGLIKGDGDGNFRPDADVNYAEAVTMSLRALGYGELIEKAGQWPANYLAKANTLELLKDVKLDGTTVGANRGSIAQIIWNMLNTEMWDITTINETNGASSTGTGKTMYQTFFTDYCTAGAANFAKGAYTAISVVDADTIEVTINTEAIRFDGVSPVSFNGFSTYEAIYKVEKVDGQDKNIGVSLYADNTNVLAGRITKETVGTPSSAGTPGSAEKITVNGTEYTFDVVGAQSVATVGGYIIAKLDNNGKITSTSDKYWKDDVLNSTIGTGSEQSLLVKEVKQTTDGATTKVVPYTGTTLDIDNAEKAVMYVTFDNGKTEIVSKDAIKANTVVEEIQVTTGKLYVVTDKTVTGTIDSITDAKYVIGGNKYAVCADDAQIKYASKTNVVTTDAISQSTDVDAATPKGKALIGKAVTVKLTSNDEIAYIDSEDVTVADNYGVLLYTDSKIESGKQVAKVTLCAFDGTITTYDVIVKADGKAATLAQLNTEGYTTGNVGSIVKFELKNGKIALDTNTDVITVIATDAATTVDTTLNKATIDLTGEAAKSYRLASDAKIVRYDDASLSSSISVEKCDMIEISLQDLVTYAGTGKYVYVIADVNDANVAKYIIIKESTSVATGSKVAVIAGDLVTKTDAQFATLYIPGQGEKEVKVNVSGTSSVYKKGVVVNYTISKDADGVDEYNIDLDSLPTKIPVTAQTGTDLFKYEHSNFTEIFKNSAGDAGVIYEAISGSAVYVVDLNGVTTTGSIDDLEVGFEVYGVDKTNTGASFFSSIIIVEK